MAIDGEELTTVTEVWQGEKKRRQRGKGTSGKEGKIWLSGAARKLAQLRHLLTQLRQQRAR